jgi:membrane-bound lytic murein transglycosylase D
MMKFFKLLSVLVFFADGVFAQSPQVPHKMQIGGITLVIKDDARKEIQKDVDALTQSPRYLNIKVERAKTYFPIIEKVFKEERVPDELKYLVLQESALIADAVSVSNAVGFWQFKDFTAIEMGLRVDDQIDERMNIASSSRAAAGYLKKNNFYFNNWIYAVQAYQMGAGGALKVVDEKYFGAKHMEIDGKTYWYVKKFIAHVVAFEGALKGKPQVEVAAIEYKEKGNISQLAKELKIDEAELREFNKWVKKDVIPGDRSYTLILPSGKYDFERASSIASASSAAKASPADEAVKASDKVESRNNKAEIIYVNGLPAIRAISGENANAIASRANVDLAKFLRYNDLSISSRIEANQIYYLKAKRRHAQQSAYHAVQPNDKLWEISQEYAIKLNRLKKLNQVYSDKSLQAGTTLWLTASKDRSSTKINPEDVVQLESETFNWALIPGEAEAAVEQKSAKLEKTTEVVQKVESANYGHQKENETLPVTEEVKKHKIEKDQEPVTAKESISIIEAEEEGITKIEPITVQDKAATEHLVKQGENLSAISRMYQISIHDLVKWNKLDNASSIKPGQLLVLKAPESVIAAEVKYVYHEVKSTDTLYSIARNYEVTIKELMEWNNKKDFNLTVGEKLRILKP